MISSESGLESMKSESERLKSAVAVVVPARNEEMTLPSCLRSIREALDECGIVGEVVVVDDDSTDRTAELAAAAGARVLSQRPRRGPLAAWDYGVRSTSAPVIVFVDADCQVERDGFGPLLARMEESDVGVVAARSEPMPPGDKQGIEERSARFSAVFLHYLKGRLNDHDLMPIGRLMAVRREAWNVERTDIAPCDRVVARRSKDAGWKIMYEPRSVVRYEPVMTYSQLRADFRRTVRTELPFSTDPVSRSALARSMLSALCAEPVNGAAWIACRMALRAEALMSRHKPDHRSIVHWDAVRSEGDTGDVRT